MSAAVKRRYITWGLTAIIIGIVVLFLALPEEVQVDVGIADVGPIEQAVLFDGRVRIATTSLVSVPVTSVYRPEAFEPGDTIDVGDILGWYSVVQLDERAERELQQREFALQDVLASAQSQRDVLSVSASQAKLDEERADRLYRSGALPLTEWERARLRRDQSIHELNAAQLRIDQLMHEGAALHAGFATSFRKGLPIRSPLRGIVLRKHVDVERMLAAGTGLYDVGTFDTVDVEADVLSAEAELLKIGMSAVIKLGSTGTVDARVLRIEPSAFTKLSALGIEEQRVKILLRPLMPLALGDGFRATGRIILWRKHQTLRAPSNAIVIDDADTSVFTVKDGRAQKQRVRLGVRSREHVELVDGIEKGTTVIVNPPSSLRSDSRVVSVE
ncbi:MAG: efflux RND transporter periplasmic adaptor subunit [Ignavibacteria bacterium]|jgi:HlyD family secretion protein